MKFKGAIKHILDINCNTPQTNLTNQINVQAYYGCVEFERTLSSTITLKTH